MTRMGRLTGAVVSGLRFRAVAVALMLPTQFPDKRTALLGAFASRFAIGFTIGCVQLPWAGWLIGFVFGLVLSLPDASARWAGLSELGLIAPGGHDPPRLGGGLVIGGILHGWK